MQQLYYIAILAVLILGALIFRDPLGDGPDLGTEFALFVDSTNTLIPENEGRIVADPFDPTNPVLELPYANWASVALAFQEEIGADMVAMVSTDPTQTRALHLRLLVPPSFADRGPCADNGSNCLSISFFDAFGGPQDRASIHSGAGNAPMRLKWFIPDSLRDGMWHDLAIPLPPTTYAALEAARTAGTLTPLQERWHYTGGWAETYGIGCCGAPPTTQDSLWREFEWDAVARIGVQYDFADGLGGGVLVDDFYLGDAYTDVSALGTPALIPPTASYPLDGAVRVPASATFRWIGRRGAAHEVQVSRDPTFATLDRDLSVTADTAVVEGLAAYQTYHWRVRATGRGETTAWTATAGFTIAGIAAPATQSPSEGATGVPRTVDFGWTTVPGGLSYRLQVATDTSFASLVHDEAGVPGTSFGGLTLDFGTRYYWRVRAESVQGPGDWSQVAWFDTVELAPERPSDPIPADGTLDVETAPQVSWSPGSRATLYHLQLSVSETFAPLLYDDSTAATSYSLGGLNKGTDYFWRVRSSNTGGTSDWLTSRFSTEMDPPAASRPSRPTDGSVETPLTVRLQWDPVVTAGLYRVQVAHSISFDQAAVDTVQVGANSIEIGPLRPYRVHFWRVKAMNRGGESDWSDVFTFRTVLNQLPQAVDDDVVTPEDAPLDVSVIANDIDLDADPLTLHAFTSPSTGHVYEVTAGVLRYIPFENWSGQDSLSYVIDDGRGGRSEAMVRITVIPVNDPPTEARIAFPLPGATLNLQGDPGRLLNLVWHPSTDVEGDSVRYRWEASLSEAFLPMALAIEAGSGTALSVPFGDIAASFPLLPGDGGVMYHRLVASDGQAETAGQAVAVPVIRGLITDVEESEIPTELTLDGLYPNPARDHLTVTIGLPHSVRVEIIVTDVLGRAVVVPNDRELPPGRHEIRLAMRSAPGLYMVVLLADGERLSLPVVVTR